MRVQVNRNGYRYEGTYVGYEKDEINGSEEVIVEKDDGTIESELPEHVTKIED